MSTYTAEEFCDQIVGHGYSRNDALAIFNGATQGRKGANAQPGAWHKFTSADLEAALTQAETHLSRHYTVYVFDMFSDGQIPVDARTMLPEELRGLRAESAAAGDHVAVAMLDGIL